MLDVEEERAAVGRDHRAGDLAARRRENERKLLEGMAEVEAIDDAASKSTGLAKEALEMLAGFDTRLGSFERAILAELARTNNHQEAARLVIDAYQCHWDVALQIVATVEPSDYGIEDFPRIRERLFNAAHRDGG